MPDDDERDREWREAATRISATFAEHTARFDSIDRQLRELTRLVEQILDRLPKQPGDTSA